MENSESVLTSESKQQHRYFIAGLVETIRGKGIAQKDLALKAHVSAVTISNVLNGKQGCSKEWRHKICLALDVTDEEMIKKGAALTMVTNPPIQEEPLSSEKLAPVDSPEQVGVTPEGKSAFPLEEVIQIIRDKFQDTEAEAKEAKAHIVRCYEIFEALHDSVTIVSADRKIAYQNHASIAFWGKHHGEDFDTVLAVVAPDSSPHESLLQKTFDLNTHHTTSVSTGSGISAISMVPVVGDMGRVDRVVIVSRPTAMTHQAQIVHARTQAALDALDFGLIIFDQDRNLVRKNKAFGDLVKLNGQEIKTFDDLQTVASRMENAGEVILRMYKVFDQKIRIAGGCMHPDGNSLWQELTPLFGNDGEFLGVACQLRVWDGHEVGASPDAFIRNQNNKEFPV